MTSMSMETIRVILEEADITYQHTKTWKASMILSLRYHRSKRLYAVLDNFYLTNRTGTEWAAENDVELIFTPPKASWLNRIECHFAPLRSFVLRGSHYSNHQALATAIRSYLRWQNKYSRHARLLHGKRRSRLAERALELITGNDGYRGVRFGEQYD